MAHTMRGNPFARRESERVCQRLGRCASCGHTRPRIYSYVWVRDDRTQSARPGHRRAETFCAFDCFKSCY
jgi:hypothetical protein